MQEMARDMGSIPVLGRSPESERGVWWAIVHRVTKNRTWLSDWAHTHTHTHTRYLSTEVYNWLIIQISFSKHSAWRKSVRSLKNTFGLWFLNLLNRLLKCEHYFVFKMCLLFAELEFAFPKNYWMNPFFFLQQWF